jgi:hypothetical protein
MEHEEKNSTATRRTTRGRLRQNSRNESEGANLKEQATDGFLSSLKQADETKQIFKENDETALCSNNRNEEMKNNESGEPEHPVELAKTAWRYKSADQPEHGNDRSKKTSGR